MLSTTSNKSSKKIWPSSSFKESKCIGPSNLSSSLVVPWWQNVCSSLWLYMCSPLNWEEMRDLLPGSLSSVFKGLFSYEPPAGLQPELGHVPIPKPVPMARQCHRLNNLGLSSWTHRWQGMELSLNQWAPLLELEMASVFKEVFPLCWNRVNIWTKSKYWQTGGNKK